MAVALPETAPEGRHETRLNVLSLSLRRLVMADQSATVSAGMPCPGGGVTPLLACDVWEHAYYIDYRQDRANWLTLWWDKLANWSFAENQYGAALSQGVSWRYPAPAPIPAQ